MAVVYILFSAKLNKHYIGSCDNLSDRISKHKDKFYINSYTSKTEDWILCLTIENLEYEQARKIEAHIKQMKSKVYIENLNKYPEIIERLKEKYK